jgi:beta-xylosidase
MRRSFMVRSLLFSGLISIVVSACGSTSPLTSTPVQISVSEPSVTPTLTVPASPAPTQVFPTVPPKPTLDGNFFRDDFGGALDAKWSWVREDPQNWSLSLAPGSLQINVGNGYVLAHSNSNLLLRPAPEGNFQIETEVMFDPKHNFEFAGLIIYQSDSNFIQAGHGFCNSVDCVGEGLYMNSYQKGNAVKPTPEQTYTHKAPVFLRLSRRADTYTFENSQDGNVWFLIGSQKSDIEPLQIGLVASQNLRGDILPATFGYFEVRSLP